LLFGGVMLENELVRNEGRSGVVNFDAKIPYMK